MPDLPSGTVTFLFTDIEGSTGLWEQDRAAMRLAVARQLAILHSLIEAHHGVLYKTVGDGTQAAFASAEDAVRAAVAAQRALLAEAWADSSGSVRVCMVLHAGEAEPDERGDYLAPVLNRLARLLAIGHGWQILLTQTVQQLTRGALPAGAELRDLGEHRLRDLLEPERVFQLVHPDLVDQFLPLASLDTHPTNLPRQPTPFLGREQAVSEIAALLRSEDVQLLTLTGAGGTGKTRLALQAAAELLDEFPDGVVFVPLGALADPPLVPAAIATAVGVREEGGQPLLEQLAAFLANKLLLLVIDNWEHLLEAASVLGDLLRSAPGLTVLATSRAPLHLQAEREYPVPPLALPRRKPPPTLEQLSQYEAVQLFIARAQAVRPDFVIDNINAPAVAEICHRLEGLPLAIELAAARLRLFPPQAMLNRLEQRLPFLTGGARDAPARQQTLRQTIAWSYDLLQPEEQTLYRRLAVFTGGLSFEAAEAVTNPDGALDIFGGLERLVEHSLMRQDVGLEDEPRYWMLETIREYAVERLVASPDEARVRQSHLAYLLRLADANDLDQAGPAFEVRLARLVADEANLRSALEWGRIHDPETALILNARLGLFWFAQGRLAMGLDLHERVLATEAGPGAPERAHALASAAWLAINLGEFARAEAMADAAFALAERLGEAQHAAFARYCQGCLAVVRGDGERATALLQDALARFEALGDRSGILACLNELGVNAINQGDAAAAVTFFDRCLALADALEDLRLRSSALANVAWAHRYLGHHEVARDLSTQALVLAEQVGSRYWQAASRGLLSHLALDRAEITRAAALIGESLGLWSELGDQRNLARALETAAAVIVAGGRAETAARLYGAVEARREAISSPIGALDQVDRERHLAAMRAALAEPTFTRAWAEGRRTPLATAVADAMEVVAAIAG